MTESEKNLCPACLKGHLIWVDTNVRNESDMGTGKPYFMCDDQDDKGCGLILGVWSPTTLKRLHSRIAVNNG